MFKLDLAVLFRRLLRDAALILLLAVVLLVLRVPWQSVVTGFICGLLVGVLNIWLLVNSIEKMVALVLSESRAVSHLLSALGMGVRWLLVLAVLVGITWTGYFNLLGLLAGYLVLPFLAVVHGLWFLVAPRTAGNLAVKVSSERGGDTR